MKKNKIIYWTATGLLSALMLLSIGMYIFNNEMASQSFSALGYPVYLVYILATAKLLGLVAILTKKSETLKEWAYAGFSFNFILAVIAHLQVGDGEFAPSLVALVLLAVSYFFEKKIADQV